MTVAIESTLQSMWTECQGCTSESQERLQEVVSELEASLTAFICKVVALEVEPSETLGDAVAVLLLDNISTTKHSHALIDILHVEWCFLNEDDDASHVRKNRILWIVKSCLQQGLLSEQLVLTIWDAKSLSEINQVTEENASLLHKNGVKYRTNALYTQKKFNLLREESEGYAKILSLLSHSSDSNSSTISDDLYSFIGTYDLDPNRLIDLLILRVSLFEQDKECIFRIFEQYDKIALSNIFGFRMKNAPTHVRSKLVKIATSLISGGCVLIDVLLAHLSPEDDLLAQNFSENQRSIRESSSSTKKLNSLSSEIQSEIVDSVNQLSGFFSVTEFDYSRNTLKFVLLGAILEEQGFDSTISLLVYFEHLDPASNPVVSQQLCCCVARILRCAEIRRKESALSQSFNSTFSISPSDALIEINRIMRFLKFYLGRDLNVLSCLCRFLLNPELNKEDVFLFVQSHLLGAISVSQSSFAVSALFWNLLSRFNVSERYSLYSFWMHTTYESCSGLQCVKELVSKASKYLNRRLSADSRREFGRMLVRFSHNNPVIILNDLIVAVESFDASFGENLIDSLSFMSTMSFDVLVYLLLSRFADSSRSKLKRDQQNLKLWYGNLTIFLGKLFRRFPDILKLGDSVISFVTLQLVNESPVDIFILQELISNMSGVVKKENMSTEQILGQAGGKTLRSLIFLPTAGSEVYDKQVDALKSSLQSSKILPFLFVGLIQTKHVITSRFNEITYVKAISDLFDTCHDVLVQLFEFCRLNIEPSLYTQCFLPLHDLLHTYNLPFAETVMLLRPSFSGTAPPSLLPDIPSIRDIFTQLPSSDVLCSAIGTEVANIPEQFFTEFWALSLFDIFVPKEQYEAVIARYQSTPHVSREVPRILQSEFDAQMEHTALVLTALRAAKDEWLAYCSVPNSFSNTFLRCCILPRLRLSEEDAVFCAKFVILLHELDTWGFRTIDFIAATLDVIPSLLASCSRKECIRFSLFLRLLFAQVDYWNRDEALFQDQFANFGCALKSSGGDDDNQEKLSFQEFGSIVEEFQKSIFTHLCNLLQGGNYMSIRNALLVISEVEEVFPKTPSHAKELADCVDDLRSSFAKGSDVYTSASRTQAQLLRVQFSLEGYSQPSTDALNPVLPSSDASSDIKEDQREEILQVSSVPSPSDAPTQTTRTIHETWQTDPETELEEGEATFSEPTNSKEDEKQADQKSVTQKRPRPELAKEDSVASRVGDKRMKISDANYRNSRERSGRFFQRRDDAFRLQDSSSRSQASVTRGQRGRTITRGGRDPKKSPGPHSRRP